MLNQLTLALGILAATSAQASDPQCTQAPVTIVDKACVCVRTTATMEARLQVLNSEGRFSVYALTAFGQDTSWEVAIADCAAFIKTHRVCL